MTSHCSDRTAAAVDTLCPRHSRLDSLLVEVGVGDREAFAALYDEFVQTVYQMSLNGGHEPSRATQITFDVFLCAWLRAGVYDPEVESAWTWLRAIAATTITAQSSTLARVVPREVDQGTRGPLHSPRCRHRSRAADRHWRDHDDVARPAT